MQSKLGVSFKEQLFATPPISNADMAELFTNAQLLLEIGRVDNICHGLRIGTPGKPSQAAVDVVRGRMGDRNTLEEWLYKRGHITYTELVGYAPHFKQQMREYRMLWLDDLIKEYST